MSSIRIVLVVTTTVHVHVITIYLSMLLTSLLEKVDTSRGVSVPIPHCTEAAEFTCGCIRYYSLRRSEAMQVLVPVPCRLMGFHT